MEQHDVHTSNPEDNYLLLRFPESIREQAGLPSPSRVPPKVSKPPRPRKKGRWLRRFVTLTLFLGLGLSGAVLYALELEYKDHQRLAERSAKLQKEWTTAKKKLQQGKTKAIYNSLPRYLKHLDQTLDHVQQSYDRYCKAPKAQALVWKWPKNKADLGKQWHNVRHWSWQHLRDPFLKGRTLVDPKTKKLKSNEERRKHCENQTQSLLSQLKIRLESSSKKLLSEARRHLRWYQWCHITWARYELSPDHRENLAKLRKNSCRSACRLSRSPSCKRCWKKRQQALRISRTRLNQYRRLLRQERQRRCRIWVRKTKRPSHQGTFHLGEYFWRVQRVLSYTHWMERHKLCDETCQNFRKEWGFRLKLTASNPKARIYVRLWPERIKAPTSWLRRIAEKPLGQADGTVVWLPALRTDLVPSPVPRQLWYLLLVVDPATRHSALLPLAPEAGNEHKQTLTLQPLEIYNDGRQIVRHPTFAYDGKWLAFVTQQPAPGEPTPDLGSPYCVDVSNVPTTQWRSAISLYPINRKGQPTSRGNHLLTQAHLVQLQFTQYRGGLRLLVSSKEAPEPTGSKSAQTDPLLAPGTGANREGDGVSLWKVDVSPSSTVAFQRPNRLSRSTKDAVDLPFLRGTLFPSVLRLRCPTPSSLQLLHNGPERPDALPLPRGYKLLHATSTEHWVAMLLQNPSTQSPSLVRYRRPITWGAKASPRRLLSSFRQVHLTRDWTLLAGGNLRDPVVALSGASKQTLWKEQPHIRYLDPAIHWGSRRTFVVQHWNIPGSSSWKPTATFLVSRPLPKTFQENFKRNSP